MVTEETQAPAEETAAGEGEGEAEGEGGARREKRAKEAQHGYETVARQEIRRARRLASDGQPTPEANFALSIANVLAMLDLASAIREHKGSGK